MKMILALVATAISLMTFLPEAKAAGGGFSRQRFERVIYLSARGSAGGSGGSYSAPARLVDGDLWLIPAGTVVERVTLIVDQGLTGLTDLDLGDEDDQNGYLDGSVDIASLATAGAMSGTPPTAAYLFPVGKEKYYSVGTKHLKLDVTGTATAGEARVIVQGFYPGPN